MDAEERLGAALAQRGHERLHSEGDVYLMLNEIEEIAGEQGASEAVTRHVLRRFDEEGLLRTGDGLFHQGHVALAILHEDRYNRSELWRQNVLRREVLRLAAEAFERDEVEIDYHEDDKRFVEAPYAQAVAAARALEHWSLLSLHLSLGHNFSVAITPSGYDLVRDEAALRRKLPVSAAEDEEAHARVAQDALADLITSVEQLLKARGWAGALRELGRGDRQYEDRHWVDAAGEYYSALESGLKHRLDEVGASYSESAALRDLARQAVKEGLVPPNYQQVFGFADSIRSPRRHGAGGQVEEVEVGPAEALLLGNHARSLLLYLGQRPLAVQQSTAAPAGALADS